MNRLLKQQIEAHPNLRTSDAEILKILNVISESYDYYEKRLKKLEKSVELTGEELIVVNKQLCAEANELRRKESHLSASQHIAHIGSWEYDEITGELYWSDETYRIFGYYPGAVEVTLAFFYQHVHPEDVNALRDAFKNAVATQGLYAFIHRLTNGRIVHERAEIIFDDDGPPLKMIGTVQDITERISADEALQKAHSELATLFENMKEAFFSVELPSGRLIQMSDACEAIYGIGVEEFKQNPNLWYEVIVAEDKKVIDNNYAIMYAGHSFTQQYRIFHRDGSLRWLETRITPTLDNNGAVIRIDGITSDITKRKEDEITIKNSEYKFRSLIEYSADAFVIIDENLNVIFASNSFERVTGYNPREISNTSFFDQIYSGDLELIKTHLNSVLSNPDKPTTVLYRRIKKDGTVIWCESIAVNLLGNPAISGIIINFRDVTEQKNYEDALEHSGRKLRALIENSAEAIIITDENLNITYASDSLYRVAGYKPDDILGSSILTLAHPDEKDMLATFMEDVMTHPGKPRKLVYHTRTKNADYIWCERVTINLLDDPAIKGVVSNFMDITERKEKEEALEISNKELQKRNDELDRFVYSVSHDLRSPLTSILGLIDVSKMCTTTSEIQDILEMIKQSVDKLDSFICDVLDYSKNARVEIGKDFVNFQQHLDDITSSLRFLNIDKPIRLESNVVMQSDFYSDNYRIGIILNNVISNAIKYSSHEVPDPFIQVTIKSDKDKATITITDNGIGIAEEYHSKIFDMFFRATAISVGSGLGLYIVNETLKKLKGSISFESTVGKGTTFVISIPNAVSDK